MFILSSYLSAYKSKVEKKYNGVEKCQRKKIKR